MKLVSIDLYNGKRLYVIKNARIERQDEILDNNTYIVWDLYPVAIWDYVDKDWSDKQGWLQEMEDGEVSGAGACSGNCSSCKSNCKHEH